ncbi:MAG: energy transducer TonB [Gammaproteobacteria bacterium]|nr:energy transducer TonB [Pseudomonadales bacterium]MCP5348087.1 energy transducer TonB [Pseudomonadales bacterium]
MKLLLVLIPAVLINLGLFLLMDSMVSRDSTRVVNLIDTQPIEFIRTAVDEETRTRDRRTPPPPKPREIQRLQADVQTIANRVSALPANVASYEVTSLLGEGAGVVLGQTLMEGSVMDLDVMMAEDLIPLTMLPPQYPPAARMRQIEGWVDLLFTVNADGTVSDPVVVEAEPAEIFNEAAMNAARRWRFRPVIRDGDAVDTLAEIRINFSLDNGR